MTAPKTIFLIILAFLPVIMLGQNAKKSLKAGEKLLKENKTEEALQEFNNAINTDANLTDAYLLRAQVYEKLEKFDVAVKDYVKASELDNKSPDHFYNAGRLYYKLGDYQQGLKMVSEATLLDPNHQPALQYKIFSLIKLADYQKAIIDCNRAIDLNKKNHMLFYCKGISLDSMNDFTNALTEYQTAIKIKPDFYKAYISIAKINLKTGNLDEALKIANEAVQKFPKETEVFLTRSMIFRQRTDYPNAINDLSQVLTLSPDDNEVLMTRGQYYFKFGQYQNAINDFTQVIKSMPGNYVAFLWRATSYEELVDETNAINDYETYVSLAANQQSQISTIAQVNTKIYEMKREQDPPLVSLTNDIINAEGKIRLPQNELSYTFIGKATDVSKLEYIKINGNPIEYAVSENNTYTFSYIAPLADVKEIVISVSDDYHNVGTASYSIELYETDPPQITFITPYTSDNGEIYLNAPSPTLYLEGVAVDDNLISSIVIDDQSIAFNKEMKNPTFNTTLAIEGKDSLTLKITDSNGNQLIKKYTINREAINISANNPMGKTWVVFVENSNYSTFASLEGPTKDVVSMKSALSNYQIHNIIHKKDMSKKELEKFFSIELRDLVRANNVNSLLIWYAGHGKFINETGYWIPIDATRDDEFTYFSINNLKAAMHAYSKNVTHVLVVTDACESGPSFYQAMRDTGVERVCGDWQATKFKSSQVFSSAGYELASDDSQFTKTFAKSLVFNENSCIPIETIVTKVTEAVGASGKQRPQFGKIQGLEDENGTFFFMKKE